LTTGQRLGGSSSDRAHKCRRQRGQQPGGTSQDRYNGGKSIVVEVKETPEVWAEVEVEITGSAAAEVTEGSGVFS